MTGIVIDHNPHRTDAQMKTDLNLLTGIIQT